MAVASSGILVVPFEQVGLSDIGQVGGKNASLGEMIQSLAAEGVRVPAGFATTAAAYRQLLAANGLEAPLRQLLGSLDVNDLAQLQAAGQRARQLLLGARLPLGLELAILTAYR